MVLLVICSHHYEGGSQGEPLYDLETQADEFIVKRMRQRIENGWHVTSLCAKSAMWQWLAAAATSEPQSPSTEPIGLDVPVFRCGN